MATTQKRSSLPKHILIVEDDEYLANAYRLKVEKEGYRVTLAGDGEQALRALQASKPDLIILDLVMPNMDGFTVLEHIRAHREWKNLQIVVMSNLGQDEDISRAKQYGVEHYLVKSDIRLKDLLVMVSKLLAP